MGESPRSQAGRDVYGQYQQLYNQGKSYQDPFGYAQQAGALNTLQNQQNLNINQMANQNVLNTTQNTTARLASQGITGGSIANQTIAQQNAPINRQRFNALEGLATGRLGQEQSLMNQENQGARTKMNMLQSILGGEANATQLLDNTTWLDDLLGGLNTVGGLALGGGTLLKGLKG